MRAAGESRLCRRLGIALPIVQGPFGSGFSTAELCAAVSNAGGLGSYGAVHLTPEGILNMAARIRGLTSKPFALNLWVSTQDEAAAHFSSAERRKAMQALGPYFRELGLEIPDAAERPVRRFEDQAQAVLEARPAVFSFVFGVPSRRILEECRRKGIVTAAAATTVDEAVLAESAGVDMIVASGFEAGGHRPSFLRRAEDSLHGVLSLAPQVADRTKVPVIAAGGIADGRGIAAALAAGADAVQIGTAFLACAESGAPEIHREMLFRAEARHTALTRVFTGRLARTVSNRLQREMAEAGRAIAPYPVQGWITGALRDAAIRQGRADLISLWAGQSAGLLRWRTAGELMASLAGELERTEPLCPAGA